MKLSELLTAPIFVFDVESIGLHGEGYAFGYIVIRGSGAEGGHRYQVLESGKFSCDPEHAKGEHSNRQWVLKNIPAFQPSEPTPEYVREKFWEIWTKWKAEGAFLAADCGWPVEANFLEECIQWDENKRQFDGPYPMIEISSVLISAGLDPMESFTRSKDELPQHDPEADARQSARLLWQALKVLAHHFCE